MAQKSYSELLKDPRWQRRRLEILQRSDFSCEMCGDTRATLNVHHKLYRKGADPWEYSDQELQALCEDCHKARHSIDRVLRTALAQLDAEDLERVLGYVQGLGARGQIEPSDSEEEVPVDSLFFEIASESYGAGFFDALWIDYTHTELDGFISQSPFSGLHLWGMHLENCVARIERLRKCGRIQ